MDDVLYTISDKLIKANDINTIKEIETVKLGYTEPKNDDRYNIYYWKYFLYLFHIILFLIKNYIFLKNYFLKLFKL